MKDESPYYCAEKNDGDGTSDENCISTLFGVSKASKLQKDKKEKKNA